MSQPTSLLVKPAVVVFIALVAVGVNADEPRKPGAVAASSSAADTGAAQAKPAAVAASTAPREEAKPSYATHLEIIEADVKTNKEYDTSGNEYLVADQLSETQLAVRGRGIETEFQGSNQTGPKDPANYDGFTAFQILLEQGFFEHVDGIGFVATEKYKKLKGIGSGGGSEPAGGGGQNTGGKSSWLDGSDLKLTSESDRKMVDPAEPESVAEDPSQKGGIFGVTVDGEWEEHQREDPNSPEVKRRRLRDELNSKCQRTAAYAEWYNCIWTCWGDECTDECQRTYDRNKPQVCRDADALAAQLGDQ
jgi:hypothetical protein